MPVFKASKNEGKLNLARKQWSMSGYQLLRRLKTKHFLKKRFKALSKIQNQSKQRKAGHLTTATVRLVTSIQVQPQVAISLKQCLKVVLLMAKFGLVIVSHVPSIS